LKLAAAQPGASWTAIERPLEAADVGCAFDYGVTIRDPVATMTSTVVNNFVDVDALVRAPESDAALGRATTRDSAGRGRDEEEGSGRGDARPSHRQRGVDRRRSRSSKRTRASRSAAAPGAETDAAREISARRGPRE